MARSPTKNKDKKKKRNDYKAWTLSDKLEVIAMRERGLTWVKIAQDKGMHEATDQSKAFMP